MEKVKENLSSFIVDCQDQLQREQSVKVVLTLLTVLLLGAGIIMLCLSIDRLRKIRIHTPTAPLPKTLVVLEWTGIVFAGTGISFLIYLSMDRTM